MFEDEITPEEALTTIDSNLKKQKKRERDLSILDELTHKAKGKKFWRTFGYEELKQVREILDFILDEKEADYIRHKEIENKKQELREKISQMLMEEGLTEKDIYGQKPIDGPIINKKIKSDIDRKPASLWYKVERWGITFYWSGRGGVPLVFQYAMKQDGTKKIDYKMSSPVEQETGIKKQMIPGEHINEVLSFLNKK